MPQAPALLNDDTIESPWASWRTEVPPISGRAGVLALVLLGLDAVAGLFLRTPTGSPLWLDEALTVSIAKLPFGSLHGALKEDGAPPLYYVLLHGWIWCFGSSAFAVRSLSTVCSLLTLVVVYRLAKRLFGLEVALMATAVLLASSFAAYYSTETRMYALLMLLTALGGVALARLVEAPGWKPALGLAGAATALLYTHYWSIYLLVMLGAWLLLSAVVAKQQHWKVAARWGIGALAVAGVAFLPWLPTFLWQSKHTGTPWGGTPDFLTAVMASFHFNHNQMAQVPLSGIEQRGAEVLMVPLFAGALFLLAVGGRKFKVIWTGLPRARFLAWMSIGLVVMGVVASHFTQAAFAPRYGSVAYVALVLLLAVGTRAVWDPWLRIVLMAGLCACMLWGGFVQRASARTQAPAVAAVLNGAPAGSVVIFCPDQLGPSTIRLVKNPGLRAYGYPRFDDPNFVNWVDYDAHLSDAHVQTDAAKIAALAGGQPIFLDTAQGYAQAGYTCAALRVALNELLPDHREVVYGDNVTFFQSMNLVEYQSVTPRRVSAN